MGTGMALLLATRSKLLAGALIIIVICDAFVNSPMTVLEHLVALLVGAATYLLVTRTHLHPRTATGRRRTARQDCGSMSDQPRQACAHRS